jgi:hypothetical protein
MQEQSFQLVLNGVPYVVKATPFEFNAETRFTVSYNGSDEFIFAHDRTVGQYVSIGDDSGTFPADLETAISERLHAML